MPKYYAERRSPLGNWHPQITPDRPAERTSDGGVVTLRRVQLLPPELHGRPLSEVARKIAARDAPSTQPAGATR